MASLTTEGGVASRTLNSPKLVTHSNSPTGVVNILCVRYSIFCEARRQKPRVERSCLKTARVKVPGLFVEARKRIDEGGGKTNKRQKCAEEEKIRRSERERDEG